MVDVRGDVLRPPHGTTPAAVHDYQTTENVCKDYLYEQAINVNTRNLKITPYNQEKNKTKQVKHHAIFS